MPLSQTEADRLLRLPKQFDPSQDQIEFRRSAFRERYDLFEIDGRERFLLDLERSQIRTAALKFQTRARTVFIWARLDINGRAHLIRKTRHTGQHSVSSAPISTCIARGSEIESHFFRRIYRNFRPITSRRSRVASCFSEVFRSTITPNHTNDDGLKDVAR